MDVIGWEQENFDGGGGGLTRMRWSGLGSQGSRSGLAVARVQRRSLLGAILLPLFICEFEDGPRLVRLALTSRSVFASTKRRSFCRKPQRQSSIVIEAERGNFMFITEIEVNNTLRVMRIIYALAMAAFAERRLRPQTSRQLGW